MAINPNVSIITACKNRVNSLKVSLSSWIQFDELKMKMPQPLELDVEHIPWKTPLKLVHF